MIAFSVPIARYSTSKHLIISYFLYVYICIIPPVAYVYMYEYILIYNRQHNMVRDSSLVIHICVALSLLNLTLLLRSPQGL
jgi:hypothetical protein